MSKIPQKIHRPSDSMNLDLNVSITHRRTCSTGYRTLKRHVTKISKSLYRYETKHDYISKLERAALRNQCSDFTEPKSPTHHREEKASISEYLKSQHAPRPEGMQIIKLPKTAFGKHLDYNNENLFVEKHFLSEDRSNASPERIKEFEEINRKYRIYKKKNLAVKSKYQMLVTPSHNKSTGYDSYAMDAGVLHCNREGNIVNYYEIDRKKYLNHSTFNDNFDSFGDNTDRKKEETNTQNRYKLKTAVERLYPSTERADSVLSKRLTDKYSTLFTEESPARPKTTLAIKSELRSLFKSIY
ncbi:unnamed protein product [Blepharisma stoltei]|uniref:Uncharacterized protein n=1 Tax=Blepharisma stoltei TaxID=1481888 RepID=A0AAU9IVJ8_9CILI|nr:unnamed protein product [Blepharisma stoltei]